MSWRLGVCPYCGDDRMQRGKALTDEEFLICRRCNVVWFWETRHPERERVMAACGEGKPFLPVPEGCMLVREGRRK